jgi:prepilin-type N-terminal cleavage/methylation domain-containing protein
MMKETFPKDLQVMQKQNGFSLLEVILAVALVGILGITIPGALSTANKTTMVGGEHTTAESVARSQMDYIQNQSYDSTNTTPVYAVLTGLPGDYSIVTPMATRLDPKGDGTANDDGLQRITVTVKRGAKTVYTLIDYKNNLTP